MLCNHLVLLLKLYQCPPEVGKDDPTAKALEKQKLVCWDDCWRLTAKGITKVEAILELA